MSKKEFLALVTNNKNIFRCLVLNDATLRYRKPHTSIEICWNANNNARTVVKIMRGNQNDLKCIEELNKYKAWMKLASPTG